MFKTILKPDICLYSMEENIDLVLKNCNHCFILFLLYIVGMQHLVYKQSIQKLLCKQKLKALLFKGSKEHTDLANKQVMSSKKPKRFGFFHSSNNNTLFSICTQK